MNISSKTILASSLLVALFAATSAGAEGRAGGNPDYADNTVSTVEVKKVSVQTPTIESDFHEGSGVNR